MRELQEQRKLAVVRVPDVASHVAKQVASQVASESQPLSSHVPSKMLDSASHVDLQEPSHVAEQVAERVASRQDSHVASQSRIVARQTDQLALRVAPQYTFIVNQLCERTRWSKRQVVEYALQAFANQFPDLRGVTVAIQPAFHVASHVASETPSDIDIDGEIKHIIIESYTRYTLNQWKPGDETAARNFADIPRDAITAGIIWSVYKAAQPVNSLKYCEDAARQIAEQFSGNAEGLANYRQSLQISYERQREQFEAKQRRPRKGEGKRP